VFCFFQATKEVKDAEKQDRVNELQQQLARKKIFRRAVPQTNITDSAVL
jgi:hypothetical protein